MRVGLQTEWARAYGYHLAAGAEIPRDNFSGRMVRRNVGEQKKDAGLEEIPRI